MRAALAGLALLATARAAAGEESLARVTDCSPRGRAGGTVCVCGSFPESAPEGLTLDGRPARATRASSGRVVLELPADLAPGMHVIAGDPARGFPAVDQVLVEVVRVVGSIDRAEILRGGATTLALLVEGTNETLRMRLANRHPDVVTLEGGEEQLAATSGGGANRLERRVRGVRRGDFRIDYELALPACPCATDAAARTGASAIEPPYERGRILVLVALGTAEGMFGLGRELARKHGLTLVASHALRSTGDGLLILAAADARAVPGKVAALASDARVRLVQPDLVHFTVGTAAPAAASLQYGPRLIRAHQLPPAATGRGVTLALIDTGLDAGHPALAEAVAARLDVTEQGFTPDAHGTLLAGIIASDPSRGPGLRGVAPGVRLLAIKACQPEGPRAIRSRCASASLARGIDQALLGGAQVLNLSVAGPRDELVARLVAEAVRRGRVVVAAAGHEGAGPPPFPAALDGVMAVTAVDARSERYLPATRGDFVDVAAPGVEIVSTAPGNHVAVFSGTSAATAFVSAAAALVIQRRSQGLDPRSLARLFEDTARDLGPAGRDALFGSGLVDACAALARASGTPESCPPATGAR